MLAGLSAGASCVLRPAAPSPSANTPASLAPADPGIELPPGAGREVLLGACIGCHDLGGLELFGGFYARDDWHELVLTMVSHGAEIGDDEVELLADYLALHW